MKNRIFTIVFNRPDILEQQINSFKKNLKNKFEFNVVYDTRDNIFLEQFKEICNRNGVNFYHHPSSPGKSPSFYGADTLQWTYNNIISVEDEDSNILTVDHDIFLLDEFDIEDFMNGYDIAGLPQKRGHITYPWQGLLFFKKKILENKDFNFYPLIVEDQSLDACGGLYSILRDKNTRYKETDVLYADTFLDINLSEYDDGYGFELHIDQKFLHYRNACYWNNNYELPLNSKKKEILDIILN